MRDHIQAAVMFVVFSLFIFGGAWIMSRYFKITVLFLAGGLVYHMCLLMVREGKK